MTPEALKVRAFEAGGEPRRKPNMLRFRLISSFEGAGELICGWLAENGFRAQDPEGRRGGPRQTQRR